MFSPLANLDFSLDYFDIDLRNQVQDLRIDGVLQDEASCRIGRRVDGTPVDPNSPTCLDALARVRRSNDGGLYGVFVNPINIARERTSGVDFSTHYRLETGIGLFRFWRGGVALRATASDQAAAYSVGINVPRVFSLAWVASAMLAAISGIIVGSIGGISSSMGVFGLSVLVVVIVGGLDSVLGALVGGILIGLIEALAGAYLGGEYKLLATFIVLVAVLLVRPYGLFGTHEIERL